MMEQTLLEQVLCAALKEGADFAELFYEDSEANTVELIDGHVEKASSQRIRGAGVRVLLGTRSAYAYTSDVSPESLLRTAKAAAAALPSVPAHRQITLTPQRFSTPVQVGFDTIGNQDRIALIRDAAKAVRAVSPEITQVVTGYMDKVRRFTVCNSEGVLASDVQPRTRLYISAVAMDGTQAQTGGENPGCSMGFEAYRERIDAEAHARAAAHTAVTMLHARECPAAFLPVVIDGGFGGVIFHEACGHSLESTSVGRGNSEFCGKVGQQIASPIVSAIDDGTLPFEWGTINVDDEGNAPRRNLLIENGILKGYMIDRLGGRQLNMAATGSARRQDYTLAPTSRMTNTFIAPGKDDDDEMIATMNRGLYAKKMGGGSVNPVTGEFEFAVSEGYWVEKGQILYPVRGATLVGRGADVLMKIDRVGRNMWMGQGMCGSLSGSVPVNVGQPRIRVSGITVGGKGGALK